MRKKQPKFDVGKEVRAIARERVGRVKSSKTIKSKKDKASKKPGDWYEYLGKFDKPTRDYIREMDC